jgi:hypothetical protein
MCRLKDHQEKVAINAVNKDISQEIVLKEDNKEDKVDMEINQEEKIKNAILADSMDIFPEIALKEDNKVDNKEDNKDQWLVSNVERKVIEL